MSPGADAMAEIQTLRAKSQTPARRFGAILLVRHGEPALSRKIKLSAQGYREWWACYELGGLLEGQTPPPGLLAAVKCAGVIISSTRRRSQETAAAVAPDRRVIAEGLFIEAPLPPPPWPSWIRFSPRSWGVIARTWWWFLDHHEGQERRAEAEVRAEKAADLVVELAAGGEDVVVLAHGFFNTMVGSVLRQRGWRCTRDEGFEYWSTRKFERRGKA